MVRRGSHEIMLAMITKICAKTKLRALYYIYNTDTFCFYKQNVKWYEKLLAFEKATSTIVMAPFFCITVFKY